MKKKYCCLFQTLKNYNTNMFKIDTCEFDIEETHLVLDDDERIIKMAYSFDKDECAEIMKETLLEKFERTNDYIIETKENIVLSMNKIYRNIEKKN